MNRVGVKPLIYVINLDRNPERLAHARAQLAGEDLAFERLAAIDARELDRDPEGLRQVQAPAYTPRAYHVPMQTGEVACYLSHRKAWATFLFETDARFAVILEDDFALRGSLRKFTEYVDRLSAVPWDMIKLWARPNAISREVARAPEGRRLLRELVVSKRTVGQIVSRSGAKRLLEESLPISRPIDVQLQYFWELGVRILAVDPPLVVDVGDTLPGSSRTKARFDELLSGKLRREVRRSLLRADLVCRSFVHFAADQLSRPVPPTDA